MSHSVLLVPHQNLYIQSYSNFPDIRWHMLVTGFGGGKTRANVMLCLRLIKELQGMKDRAGDGARIIVAGYTLNHLSKTFILYFLSYLNSSKTEYTYDKKNNLCYIGTVTIIFLPMEQPDALFGEDACIEGSQRVHTLRGMVPIKDVEVGDYVLTRKGYKQVLTKWLKGDRITCNYGGLVCTPDHKIITDRGAEEICQTESCYSLKEQSISAAERLGEVQTVLSELRKCLGSVLSGEDMKVIHTSDAIEKERTICCMMLSIRNLLERYLSDGMSITRTGTMITDLRALSVSVPLDMQAYTTLSLTEESNLSRNTDRTSQKENTGTHVSAQSAEKSMNLTALTEETKDVPNVGCSSTEEMPCSILRQLVREFIQRCAAFAARSLREESGRTAALSADIDRTISTLENLYARTVEKLSNRTDIRNAVQIARESSSVSSTMNTDIELLIEFVQSAEKLLEELLTKIVANSMAEEKVPEGLSVGIRTVYDIEVEDAHEFFAEGVLVHNCACIQEESDELPEATLIEACKALSERTRQQIVGFRSPFICLGTTSQGQSGLYRLYCQFIKQGTAFVLIRGRTQDNFYLPKEQIVDLYKLYDETERRVFLNGEFLMVNKGRVFPGFTWEHNYIDDDMDLRLKRGERVYIGMDFNCIAEGSRVETIYGPKQIEHIEVGDLVLTRKGYKHVLTKKSKGVKIVREYGGLWATPDHPAITPEGDVEICKAQSLYCLKEQYMEELDSIRNMTEALEGLRLYCSMEQYGEDTPMLREKNLFTSMEEEQPCTEQYMRNLWNLFQKACRSIIPMEETTTDLRVLFFCLPRNIQDCIRNWQEGISEKNHGNTLTEQLKSMLITSLMKDGLITQDTLKRYGEAVGFVVQWCAEIAAESLKLKSARHSDALSAVESTGMKASGNLTEGCDRESIHQTRTALRLFVSYAERRLSEAAQPVIVRNIEVIGNAQGMSERESEVFDIEVEDAHEFFAEGVLVHNCGYSRASAWVVRDDTCHCVKSYDFPDAADAPDVFRHDFPTQDIFWIPDVTTKDSYPQYARALRRNNIHIIHRSKNPIVEDTAFLVSVLCKSGRIMFHKMAREAADAIARAARDKDGKIGKGKAPSDWQHYADGVRYAVSYIALVNPEFKDIRRTLITHIASLRREVEKDEEPVRKLKAGYTQIDGDAFFRKEGLTLKKKKDSI